VGGPLSISSALRDVWRIEHRCLDDGVSIHQRCASGDVLSATAYSFSIYLLVVHCRTQFFYPTEELYVSRPIFEQINTYTVNYFTEFILSKTQKENKINISNKKHIRLKNTVDIINKQLASVVRVNTSKSFFD